MKKGILIGTLVGLGASACILTVGKSKDKKIIRQKELAEKHLVILQTMNKWLMLKQQGKSLSVFFENHNYHRVAIYGMSYLGERLLDDLKAINIDIAYAIDKNANNLYSEIEILSPDDKLEAVDTIIVTSPYYFDDIEELLREKVNCPIISLEDVLYESDL